MKRIRPSIDLPIITRSTLVSTTVAGAGAGLRDTYSKVVGRLPAALVTTGFVHGLETDQPVRLGTEADLLISRSLGKFVTMTAKFATFSSSSPNYPDVHKLWRQMEFIR